MVSFPLAPSRGTRLLLEAYRGVRTLRTSSRRESAIHRAADKHLMPMQKVITAAFDEGRKAVKGLRSATTEKQAMTAVDGVPKAIQEALKKMLPAVLLDCLAAGGEVGMKSLGKFRVSAMRTAAQSPFRTRFDVSSPEAIEWAREHAAELADGLSETSRTDIAEAIAEALEFGTVDEAYDEILGAVGNAARAEIIARTEIMHAANEGLAQSWDQAVEDGLLTGNEKKEWIATSGCCDECDEVDGEQVGLEDTFSIGDDPPAHPNCRCTMGLVA